MNYATISLIKKFESLHDGDLKTIGLQPKLDPILIWTEGYGHAIVDGSKNFVRGEKNKELAYKYSVIKNENDANKYLEQDLLLFANISKTELKAIYWEELNDNQKGALTSFVFNCGSINKKTKQPYFIFEKIRLFLENRISKDDLIKYWKTSVIKADGKVLQGLINRRTAEVQLFFS